MPSEKFHNTSPKSISEILKEIKTITIPHFQRNYSWHSNTPPMQVPVLWNDLFEKFLDYLDTNLKVEGEYLLGPMVFVQDGGNSDKLEIVDGQQRLATITMIFCIVRDLVIELKEDVIKQNPATKPPGLDDIIGLIENRTPDVQTNSDTHDSWKLKLNSTDHLQYRDIFQKYECEIDDKFCDPGYNYKKISKKIEFIKDELKGSSRDNYQESQLLLFEAYLYLYTKIDDALITNFENDISAQNFLDKLGRDSATEVDNELKITPGKYGLPNDFFNHDLHGLDVLINRTWTPENEKIIQEEHQTWNDSRRNVDRKKTFEDWIKNKIQRKKIIKQSSGKNYSTIREHEITKIKNIKSRNIKITNLPRLLSFCKNEIGNCIFSVRVIVKNEEDAFQIFETLNERGQQLSKSNLIKNWVLKQLVDDEEGQKELSARWDKVVNSLSKKDPDKFLKESLRSRGYKDPVSKKTLFDSYSIHNYHKKVKVTNNNLYKIIKYKIDNEAEARNYVSTLESDVDICNQFDDPRNEYPDTPQHLSDQFRDPRPVVLDMSHLNAEYIRLPLLTAYRKWGRTSDEFIILVKFLVPFFFRYKTVSDKNTTKLESSMLSTCEQIENGTDPKTDVLKIIKFLLQEDDEDEFSNDFIGRFEPPSEDIVKFVLQHITTYLGSKYDDVTPIEDLTLEHILPQKPRITGQHSVDLWNEHDFFTNYDEAQYKILKRFTRWHKKLGNLTLLKKKINNKIKNDSFISKRDAVEGTPSIPSGYNSSKLEINLKTVMIDEETQLPRNEWTANSILKRGTYFADLATKIWALPEIICSDITCPGNLKPTKCDGSIDIIDNEKCEEDRGGQKCGKELKLRWPKDTAPEYRVPTTYL